jgi:hypothetical protein
LARTLGAALLALALGMAGCGGGGVSAGATVSVYVAAPLCTSAQRELSRNGPRSGDVEVRAVCLPTAESGGHLDLATIGANARRATEDSSSVAYLEGPNRTAAEFSHSILESAEIAWLQASSGSAAMRRVLRAVEDSSSSSLRADLRESLDAG